MNISQEFMLEVYESRMRFNTDILSKVKEMKASFLARFVGIPSNQVNDFKKGFEDFLKERTQFQSFKKAILAYLPVFRAQG